MNAPAGHLVWTPEEDEYLQRAIEAGHPYSETAKALGRTENAAKLRASLKGWKLAPEVVKAHRLAGTKALYADPERAAARSRQLRESLSEETREKLSRLARERNLAGELGVRHHSPRGRKNIAAGVKRYHDTERLSWLPREHPLRAEYTRLVARRGAARAAEAVRERLLARELRGIMSAEGRRPVGAELEEVARIWCSQCERQKLPNDIAACQSRFCKAKEAIAA